MGQRPSSRRQASWVLIKLLGVSWRPRSSSQVPKAAHQRKRRGEAACLAASAADSPKRYCNKRGDGLVVCHEGSQSLGGYLVEWFGSSPGRKRRGPIGRLPPFPSNLAQIFYLCNPEFGEIGGNRRRSKGDRTEPSTNFGTRINELRNPAARAVKGRPHRTVHEWRSKGDRTE